ncbi:hypothetical protein [Amycolatopsis magusensis]|uniref:hypothetical protein n=1 Tax=Amycolatopsis magusensis TaxID=882444 RepID=UPI003C30724A
MRALGAGLLRIGPEIAPGSCWSGAETRSPRARAAPTAAAQSAPSRIVSRR